MSRELEQNTTLQPHETQCHEKPTTTKTDEYSTFTPTQKRLLIWIASIAATFSGAASNIYFPALPAIAKGLNVSVTLVNLTVTTYMIFQGLAPSIWAAIADVKGRRMAYLCTFCVFLGACVGLANTQNYTALLVLRCLQSTGSASTIAIGSGVIGDITTRAERGGYMGIFQAGLLVPVAVGPIIGGALAGSLGWRSIFWFLTIYSAVFLVVLIFAFPETLRTIAGNGSVRPDNILHRQPLAWYQSFQSFSQESKDSTIISGAKIDLLGAFRILFSSQAILIVIFLSIYYTVWQMSITVMSTLFSRIYGLTETEIGLTFIANGVGCMVGTIVTGKILDIDYRRAKTKLDSEAPEQQKAFSLERARLRLLPLYAALQCAAILIFGWTLQYSAHISIPIISTFVTGWMAVSIQSAVMTYLVDVFHEKSASAGAAVNVARCLMGAGGTAVVEPMVQGVGVGGCFSILTGVMVLGLVLVGLQGRVRRSSG